MSGLRLLLMIAATVSLTVALSQGTGCEQKPPEFAGAAQALRGKRPDQARVLLDSAIKRSRGIPAIYGGAANLCAQSGAYALSAEYAEAGLAANPKASREERVALQQLAGSAYLQVGQPRRAIEVLRVALAAAPSNAETMNNLGYALAEAGSTPAELQEALTLTTRAVAAAATGRGVAEERERSLGVFLDSLGWVYYRLGKHDEALTALRQAAALVPGEGEVAFHLAQAYEAKGRYKDAYIQLRRAASALPHDARILKRLAEVRTLVEPKSAPTVKPPQPPPARTAPVMRPAERVD